MLVTKKIKNKKRVAIITAVAVLLAASPFVYVYAFNGNLFGWQKSNTSQEQTPAINYDEPTQEQIDAGNDAKADSDATFDSGKGEGDDSTTTPLPSGKYAAEVTIIDSGSTNGDGDLSIRASVDAIDSEGKCTLNILTKSGAVVVNQTADTQAQSSYSSCLGFTVSKSDVPSGTYTVKITYSSNSHEGSASAELKL